MGNLYTSTNDPLFWIHHGGIDNFWWRWQGRNQTRLNDARRSVISFHQDGEPLPKSAKGRDIHTSLETEMTMVGRFAPVIPIKAVMDTINADGQGILCYVYDSDSYT
jgi:tyrosinase